jgi:MFS family permease
MRFLAGIGLAGELGAGITLVSETMPAKSRGLGTSLVAAVGICGAVAAYWVGERFTWSTAYIVGGVMGLLLLCFRVGVLESSMFRRAAEHRAARGDFFALFRSPRRALRYLGTVFVGIPIWFVVGVLMTFCPEIGKALGMSEPPQAGRAVVFCYVGLACSDLASGFVSMWLKSRKLAVAIFLAATAVGMALYFFAAPVPLDVFYTICFVLGLGCGYWAMFVTIASEQFGTNLRATATTTVPNFVRGAVPLLTSSFQALKPSIGIVASARSVGMATLVLAALSILALEETYGKDLDYLET